MSATEDLLARLISIDSVNPTLIEGAAGESAIADFVASWCRDEGLEVVCEEVAPGRRNVIASRRGTGDGPTLLLLAHTDTVGTEGMTAPLTPVVRDGGMHGRGAYDMKGGLAAAMLAVAGCHGLAGDVVLAAVCDEEAGGIGTRGLLASGRVFDAAVVTEPTDLQVVIAHKGFAAFEFETSGVAAHGSRPDLGDDAILKMGPVLEALTALDAELRGGPAHPTLGTGSLHASLIEGGREASSYPESCLLTGEWRTVPGDDVEPRLRAVQERCGSDVTLRLSFSGAPFAVPSTSPIVETVLRHAKTKLDVAAYWADSALLSAAGIPTVLFGPAGAGAHAAEEWVDLASVGRVTDVLVRAAEDFCGFGGA